MDGKFLELWTSGRAVRIGPRSERLAEEMEYLGVITLAE
jgi:hypothetical protein